MSCKQQHNDVVVMHWATFQQQKTECTLFLWISLNFVSINFLIFLFVCFDLWSCSEIVMNSVKVKRMFICRLTTVKNACQNSDNVIWHLKSDCKETSHSQKSSVFQNNALCLSWFLSHAVKKRVYSFLMIQHFNNDIFNSLKQALNSFLTQKYVQNTYQLKNISTSLWLEALTFIVIWICNNNK